MHVQPSTFLVRDKRFNTDALCIPATGVLGVRHIPEQGQRLLLSLRPTTEPQHWTIGLPGHWHGLECEQPPRLATRPHGSEAAGGALPWRHGAQRRAAPRGPTCLGAGVLELRPLQLA